MAYFFDSSLKDAIRRNNQRSEGKKIPMPGVAGTFRKIQRPTFAEGFDEIHVVRISEDNSFAVTADGTESIEDRAMKR